MFCRDHLRCRRRQGRGAALAVGRRRYFNFNNGWKKDSFYDTIPILSHFHDFLTLTKLKSIIAGSPDGCIPISAVARRGRALGIPPSLGVASFLRRYPSVFSEFHSRHRGQHSHPHFSFTPAAAAVLQKESSSFAAHRAAICDRLRRILLMCHGRQLNLSYAKGILVYLGLPENYLSDKDSLYDDGFEIGIHQGSVEVLHLVGRMESDKPLPLSALQLHAMSKLGMSSPPVAIPFPWFLTPGQNLRRKANEWLHELQGLPYVSPYEHCIDLNPRSLIAEKRAVGVLHELLSLFVDCSAQRRRLICLKKHLRLPQECHKVFERHPHVFYKLMKEDTCYVLLKEAYLAGFDTAIQKHPMLDVKNDWIRLMIDSRAMIRSRRSGRPVEIELRAVMRNKYKRMQHGGMEE